jgi:hypothetical protein
MKRARGGLGCARTPAHAPQRARLHTRQQHRGCVQDVADRAYLERGLCAHERLDLHLDGLAVLERARCDTGEVESLQTCASASPRAPPERGTHPCWTCHFGGKARSDEPRAGAGRRVGGPAAVQGWHTHVRLLHEAERHRQHQAA